MADSPRKQSRYGDLLVLVAFALGLLVYVVGQFEDYTWIVRDGRFYVNSNVTLLENLSYEDIFARSWYEERLGWNYNLPAGFSNVALGSRGELYHFRPWLLPLLSSPFYFAFGLYGVLLFNLLTYAAIMACAYLFAARFAGRRAAALATALWVLGTGMVETVYDYSVDALLVAFFVGALELLRRRRGVLAGAFIAATLAIKPTSLLYVPAAAALLFELPKGERKKVLLHAIGGGAAALLIAGAVNTYMYGAPWVFGYNRVVEVVRGEIQLASTGARFNTPLLDGLQRTFGGGYGLLSFYGVYAAVLFGIWPMLRRHFRFASVTLACVTGVLIVFSLYDWESDRFQYASFALLLPFFAWGLRSVANWVRRLAAFIGRRPVGSAAALAAVGAFSMSLAHAGRDARPHPWREQVSIHELRNLVIPAHEAEAITLAEGRGTLSFRDIAAPPTNRDSPLSLGRGGAWLPRGNLAVVGFSALAAHFHLRMLLHALLAALGFALLVSASRGFAPAPARLALMAAALALHPIREMVAYGGESLFAFVALAGALASARRERPALAFALGCVAAFILSAPILLVAFGIPLLMATRDGLSTKRAAVIAGVAIGGWALYGLAVYGRPFEGAESFVFIGGERFSIAPDALATWERLRSAHPARGALVLAAAGAVGAVGMLRRAALRPLAIAALVIFAGFFVPSGYRHGALEASYIALLLPFIAFAAAGSVRVLADVLSPHHAARLMMGACILALTWGMAWRIAEARGPLRIESFAAVRGAEVHLGELPCDFLAWENASWECASHDGGTDGRTGLQLPGGAQVGGRQEPLFVVPTGRGGRRARRVSFADSGEGPHLVQLRWVVPDGYRGAARVTFRWGEEVIGNADITPGQADEAEFNVEGPGPLTLQVDPSGGEWTAVGFAGSID